MISLKNTLIRIESQGSEEKQPIIFLEDMFSSQNVFDNIHFLKNYFYLNYVNIEINTVFIQSQKRPFTLITEGLTELLHAFKEKPIVITSGYTATLLMYLAVLEPNKINSIILLHPPVYKSNSLSIFSDNFRSWLITKNDGAVSGFYYRSIFLKDFLKFMKIVHSQKVKMQSYLLFAKDDPQKVPSTAEILTLFQDRTVIKFDSDLLVLGKEKRFQKVLYSIIKERTPNNFSIL
jgi:hypothetical protein